MNKAKELLISGNYTCVICKGEDVHVSTLRGVKPLTQWIEDGKDFKEYAAADKVVGKATAFLYAILRVKSVYAKVISEAALEVLEEQNILIEYETLVANIINRQGNGICPFEAAVLDVKDTQTAYEIIRRKMRELNIN